MPRKRWLILLFLALSGLPVRAQDVLASDALTSADSLSVFLLLDSLMQLQTLNADQLSFRLGYNSNVLSTGRTLGIDNFGLAPGVAFYHHSGFYADVTGYWSNDFEPDYYLTTASAGYLGIVSPHFSFMANYDHYFYHTGGVDLYIPYTNAITISPLVDLKNFQVSASYTLYFGKATVHRIMPGFGYLFQKKKWKKIDRISITPMVYALFGNETLIELQYPATYRELIRRLRAGLPLYDEIERSVFGVMNYNLSIPISISFKKWNLNLAYNYSIPKALEGETITLTNTSFMSGSLVYTLDLK